MRYPGLAEYKQLLDEYQRHIDEPGRQESVLEDLVSKMDQIWEWYASIPDPLYRPAWSSGKMPIWGSLARQYMAECYQRRIQPRT